MSYGVKLAEASFWIDRAKLERYLRREQCSIESLLDNEWWAFRFDRDGNVVDIDVKFEFLGGEIDGSFEAIAPYVRKGSFIELEGEDGELGRFDFDGKSCEQSGAMFVAGADDD